MAHDHWPVWGISIRTPRLDLRPVREAEMLDLVELAARGIHDRAIMPFEVPWTDTPSPRREQEAFDFWMGCWASLGPQAWRLAFAAYCGDECVGTQDLAATDYPERRTVVTGSWLGLAHQRRGLGKELRAAVLHLAFGALGARRAESAAFDDNEASIGVSTALGYRADGEQDAPRRGSPARQVRFVMDRDHWSRSAARAVAVTVEGVDAAVLEQLGAG